jgi:microcompartment protein CcmL/EutN
MICGQVAAIERSMEVGVELGGRYVVGELLIPRINPAVIHASQFNTNFHRAFNRCHLSADHNIVFSRTTRSGHNQGGISGF